jgi:hypothetical protein
MLAFLEGEQIAFEIMALSSFRAPSESGGEIGKY